MSKIVGARSWLAVLTVAIFQTTIALAADQRAPLSAEIVQGLWTVPEVKITSLQKGLSITNIVVNQRSVDCRIYRRLDFSRMPPGSLDWRLVFVDLQLPITLEFGHYIIISALDYKVPFSKEPPSKFLFNECQIPILQLDVEPNYDDWTFRFK
jgi:hypothetical protein